MESPFILRNGIKVVEARDITETHVGLKADVVVVGSGAGGAVAAYELAKAGHSVIILEAGPYVASSGFNEKLGEMMELLYQDQGAQPSYPFGDLIVGQGACVGGSTVVNATISFRFPDFVYKEWGEEHGLTNITKKTMEPYFDDVEKKLAIHTNDKHEINECAIKVIEGCNVLGTSWKPCQRNVKQCAITGHCLSGCPSDRKMSMLVTYLPWASAHGATLYSDTHVVNVRQLNGRATGVDARVVDRKTSLPIATLRVDADVVILAAGAIQTPLIMQRSEIKNKWIGKNFSAHPFVSVLGKFKEPVYGWRGALTGIYVDHYLKSKRYLLESGLAEPEQLIAQGESGTGQSHLDFMKEYKYFSAMNCFIHDDGHGEVKWKGNKKIWNEKGEIDGSKQIKWTQNRSDFNAFKEITEIAGKIYFAAGAEKVYLPTYKKLSAESPEELEDILDKELKFGVPNGISNGLYSFRAVSVHPQGTARMGSNPNRSVVDPFGESHNLKGLFVTDASIFPKEITVNPQTPIFALSKFIADNILKRSSSYFLDN